MCPAGPDWKQRYRCALCFLSIYIFYSPAYVYKKDICMTFTLEGTLIKSKLHNSSKIVIRVGNL